MKLAIVNQPWEHVHPRSKTSLVIWTYRVARELVPEDDVLVYSRGHHRLRFESKSEEGIDYRYVPTGPASVVNGLQRVWWRLFGFWLRRRKGGKRPAFATLFSNIGYSLLVALDLRKRDIDVVHIHNFSQFVSVIRFFNPKVRISLHMNCEWLTQLDRGMVERRLQKADYMIGCSDFVTNNVREMYPNVRSKFVTVFNGVEAEQFAGKSTGASDDAGLKLMFVGRVSPEKGIHVMLDAIEELRDEFPNLHLEIIGNKTAAPFEFIVGVTDDPLVLDFKSYYPGGKPIYPAQVEERADKTLSNHVTFVGPLQHDEIVARFQSADVFLFPSVWHEPFGMPPVESMAAGVPVVATRSGGIPETVVDGETGFLVERGDAIGLAQALRKLLSDTALRQRMGAAGRIRAREVFGWDKIAEAISDVYKADVQYD